MRLECESILSPKTSSEESFPLTEREFKLKGVKVEEDGWGGWTTLEMTQKVVPKLLGMVQQ